MLKGIRAWVPVGIKKFCGPWLRRNSYYVQKAWGSICPPVVVFEGMAKDSNAPLSLAYAGVHAETMQYWAGALLSAGYRRHAPGRRFIGDVRSFVRRAFPQCGLILVEHNELTLNRVPGFRVPFWVTMELDLTEPPDLSFGRQGADIDRRIRKNGLSYVMTKELSAFDDFYHNMYRPYIRERHTDTALLETYEDVRQALSDGELILIRKDGRVLAGGMVEFARDRVRFRRLGVRDANWDYVRYGVLGALYYFLALEMKNRGCGKLQIGGTRPLLNDGVTAFKRSLNAYFVPDQKRSCVWMAFMNDSPGLRHVLRTNALVVAALDNRYCRAVFLDESEEIPRSFKEEGLAETHVFVMRKDLPAPDRPDQVIKL